MARTFGGLLFYGAANINYPFSEQGLGAAQFAWNRNALGDNSINGPGTAAAGTLHAWLNIADVKRPGNPFVSFPAYPGQGTVPLSNEFQEVFGTAAGGPGNPMGPGFSGTPAVPWGLAIIDIVAVYAVVTTALTTATLSINRATYVENTAFTNTAVLAATGVALTVTASATSPHVQKVTLPQPLVYESTDNSDVCIEFLATTGATANSLKLYGLGCHVAVEYS